MDDAGAQLLEALSTLEEIADSMTPEEATARLDTADLQMFWREWPRVSSWSGALWRSLNADLEAPASMQVDAEFDEVGEAG